MASDDKKLCPYPEPGCVAVVGPECAWCVRCGWIDEPGLPVDPSTGSG